MGLKVFRSTIFPKIDEVGQCINMYIFLLLLYFSCLLSFGLCVILECEQSKGLFSRNSESDWKPGESSSTKVVVTDKQGRQLVSHE